MILWILIPIAALAISYWILVKPHSYWSRRGVPQGKPLFIFGHGLDFLTRRCSFPDFTINIYNMSSNSRYFGLYTLLTPHLLIRDPELIKQVTVKDFEHFVDHRPVIPQGVDPLFDRNLFASTGSRWRELRSTLSPSFTSSKMKYIFSLMAQNGEQFVNYFLKKTEDVVQVEMKDAVSKFSNDVLANVVFGFECDSLENPNNEFYLCGREVTDFTTYRKFVTLAGYMILPSVLKFFKMSPFAPKNTRFFSKVVEENIRSREKSGVNRPDMISLLLETRKNILKHDETATLPDTGFATVEESEIGKNQKFRMKEITDLDITAQAFQFFFAGFDAVSTLLCFMAHELAVNPDIQKRLRKEVDEAKEKCEGKITYETITTMKYMDMVVSETLRLYPNSPFTDRVCTKPYSIEPKVPGEKPVRLEKGDFLFISLFAIHRDPQYYPDPDRFDPERFSDENKSKIQPYTYFPFGVGPRSCIGSRFALLEAKVFFYYVLANFEIVPVEKTQIPIKFSKKALNMAPEGGFWVGFRRRAN